MSTCEIFRRNSPFVIAELSCNHRQDLQVARESLHAIEECGAHVVKLQTYTADTMTLDSQKDCFRIGNGSLWDGQYFYRLYEEAHTPWEWHAELKELAEKLGLVFFSSPFDPTAVDFLDKLGVPAYKIASFEITDIPLIEYTASKGKTMIISTGIARIGEIDAALAACRRAGNNDIILMKCTSVYPATLEQANLLTIPNMRETFGVRVGLSDHTNGTTAAIAATALGAVCIEKHFILDKKLGGPDAAFSMEPAEFGAMVRGIEECSRALGRVSYELPEAAERNRAFSRSLFVVEDVKAGETFTARNVRSIRPGYGLPPAVTAQVLGKTASKDIEKGTPLAWDHIQ